MSKPVYSVLGQFSAPKQLILAVKALKKEGYSQIEAYTPFPVHGLGEALSVPDSRLGWISLGGGFLGLAGSFLLQTWVAVKAYPLVISGKPLFSWQAFIPVSVAFLILSATLATFFGMLILNGLPKFYHPLFGAKTFSRVTTDGFFVEVRSIDPKFTTEGVSKILESLGAITVETVEESE